MLTTKGTPAHLLLSVKLFTDILQVQVTQEEQVSLESLAESLTEKLQVDIPAFINAGTRAKASVKLAGLIKKLEDHRALYIKALVDIISTYDGVLNPKVRLSHEEIKANSLVEYLSTLSLDVLQQIAASKGHTTKGVSKEKLVALLSKEV